MQTLILTLHIIVCVLLVILVLLQAGKEGILAKLTTLMAVIFVITSLSYTYVSSSRSGGESTILDVKIEDSMPATPSAIPPGGDSSQEKSSPGAQ